MTHEPSSCALGSPDRFGYEWDVYSDIVENYEEQFLGWTQPLKPEDWNGKSFLDVGCGMGRNSYWPARYGAARGVSIDLDDRSLAAARQNLASLPVEVRKLSAYEIDYQNEFDVVFSIGVIHHLSEPQKVLNRMVQAARPGGTVLIWVYGFEGNEWIVHYFDPFRKMLFRRLPVGLVHALSVLPTAALWLALRLGFQPLEYFRKIRKFSFSHLRSIVFDQMLPNIANYWSRAEAEALLRNAGLQDIRMVWVNELSWTVIGTKPPTS